MEDTACRSCLLRPTNVGRWRWRGGRVAGGKGVWCDVSVAALCLMSVVVTTSALTRAALGTQLRPRIHLSSDRDRTEQGVCQSMDIRNTPKEFAQLEGCRVVEGFVQIVLMDKAVESDFANISFPELREITGYLLLYRVDGLKTLGNLFPNLAVIRGNTLFFNYALVVYEMLHLQELGLKSLTAILRGSVNINKNPTLCYVDTIDWDKITASEWDKAAPPSEGGHSITDNKKMNECPICTTSTVCPSSSSATNENFCWNSQHCQKLCSKCGEGQACMDDGTCCDKNCLGGCNGTGPSDCFACRGFLFQGTCVTSCPVQTFQYLQRRCLLEQECYNMPKPREIDEVRALPWKPFKNQCLLDCPPNYAEAPVDNIKGLDPGRKYYRCEPCKGPCKKECDGLNVDSIASSQRLRGCTYIRGSLEIQIRGGYNVVKELESNLNMIEEINGYLKIVRSFPLVSLNFLKKLRVINGERLESGKYALVVLDNQNLVELWDPEALMRGRLRISKGKLFFHFNPKLCYFKIDNLRKYLGMSEFTDNEVARNSNGDKVACNISPLDARVETRASKGVIIKWKEFEHYDPRTLLGYIIYFIEAPYQNISLYDGRDACGGDGWRVIDVSPLEKEENETATLTEEKNTTKYMTQLISQLNPYTQYAFYVKTYTIASENSGAQSPIIYFRTEPDTPSIPLNLIAKAESSSEIKVSWQPPLYPNGNVTHYFITAKWERDDSEFLAQRNYCEEPLTSIVDVTNQAGKWTALIDDDKTNSKSDECVCMDEKKMNKKKQQEKEIQFQIQFEDTLQNLVYIKRPSLREKREISLQDGMSITENHFPEPEMRFKTIPTSNNEEVKNSEHKIAHLVRGKTNILLKNLKHYGQYTIAVSACRERDETEKVIMTNNCSSYAIMSARTKKLANADVVTDIWHEVIENPVNHTQPIVKIFWTEPAAPNGLIVMYQISHWLVFENQQHKKMHCISRRQFIEEGNSHTLTNLAPGNYSYQVCATSLAGAANCSNIPLHYFEIQGHPAFTRLQIFIALLMTTMLFVLCGVVLYLRQKSKDPMLIAECNPEYVSTEVYIPDAWEVPRSQIQLIRELGQGSFGMVWEGIAKNLVPDEPLKKCAVKTVNEGSSGRERLDFLKEASVMKGFNTHHVVRLIGVVSQGHPTWVVMELMANGDLKSYLRLHRPDATIEPQKHPPTLKRIRQMAIEIADGMAYLAAKKFVHRDLAARNCMVAEDLTVKVGDFGMTRDIYETDYYRKGTKGLLPVRWMSPESLKDGVFTSSSDVWSYGVVIWEMATLASQPYQGLSNEQVLHYVKTGGAMERPDNCPDVLFNLMRQCWQHKPGDRPTFMQLVRWLLPFASPHFADVSFYHSDEGALERRSATTVVAAQVPVAVVTSGQQQQQQQQQQLHQLQQREEEETPLRVTREVEDFSLTDDEEEEEEEEDEEEMDHVEEGHHHLPADDSTHACSDSSKVSNGSATPVAPTPNGFIRRANGNSVANVKTTKC